MLPKWKGEKKGVTLSNFITLLSYQPMKTKKKEKGRSRKYIPEWPSNAPKHLNVARSHTRTVESYADVTSVPYLLSKSRHMICSSWP